MATSYVQAHFGSPINEITPAVLLDFFSVEREESLTLELKSFVEYEDHVKSDSQRKKDLKSKTDGLLKTICAFLNSSGGLLIWGAPKGAENPDGIKFFTGALTPIDGRILKDDFINKLINRIIPFAAPVEFHSIEIESGQFVYLIDVPESTAKPHQFEDKYYIRLDGQSKPAEHYIIDAMFKQVKRPVLYASLIASQPSPIHRNRNGQYDSDFVAISLQGTIYNLSEIINDKNIYCRLQTDIGFFAERSLPNNQSQEIVNESVRSLLPNGIPAQFSYRLFIKAQEFDNNINTRMLTITLTVGGELSAPIKQTYVYYLRPILDQYDLVADVELACSEKNPKPLKGKSPLVLPADLV